MNLKKTFGRCALLVLLLVPAAVCPGQTSSDDAKYRISLKSSPKEAPGDMDARAYFPKKDINDHLCAIVKVTVLGPHDNPFILETGGVGVEHREEKANGEVWFWVGASVRNLHFSCKGFERMSPVPVVFREGTVYRMTVEFPGTSAGILPSVSFLKLRVSPEDATVRWGGDESCSVGARVLGNGLFSQRVSPGTCYYTVTHPMYKTCGPVSVELGARPSEIEVDLEPDYSILTVTSEPDSAEISFDGRTVGVTPYSFTDKVHSGTHELRLSRKDYYAYSASVDVDGKGKPQTISAKMKPQWGLARIACPDRDAEIWIDDALVGRGSVECRLNSSYAHSIEVRREGYEGTIKALSVSEGGSVSLDMPVPVPIYGTLVVEANLMDCRVLLDGRELSSSAPYCGKALIGKHVLTLSADGYESVSREILVEKDKETSLNLKLEVAAVVPVIAPVAVKADLSAYGTANCYIVSAAGKYKFKATVKGNSTASVGTPASAEVLWESFGTSTAPSVGDIVNNVSYSGGYVFFSTPSTLNNGNAVIAVKNASGTILWSWHIWVCDGWDPKATAQVYNNNAGTVMDRNLGATSSTPGDVHALGLLYQWSRKDPFLSGNGISSSTVASSTLSWPSSVSSSSSSGTIDYAVKHPTTFITYNTDNFDWYYTGSSDTDNTRWTTSSSTKGVYDPCPPGWRVPDGGDDGLWSKAFGSSSYYYSGPWDSSNKGMNFGSGNGKSSVMQLGSSSTVWYPAAGCRYGNSASLYFVGYSGRCWSSTPIGNCAFRLFFYDYGSVSPSCYDSRAYGYSVRCLRESAE